MDLPTTPSLLPGSDSPAARRFFQRVCEIPRLAHHPTCRCYDSHLIRLGRLSLCLGCSCVAAGALSAAAALAWVALTRFDRLAAAGPWRLVALGVLLYTPTLGQFFIRRKPYKIASRFLLGVATAILWFAAVFLLPLTGIGLALRGVFVAVFVAVYKLTQRARSRFADDPCLRCAAGAFPFCRDNLARHAAALRQLEADARAEDKPFVEFVFRLGSGPVTTDRAEGGDRVQVVVAGARPTE